MGKSYEERMSEKYNFLKHKDESDVTNEEVDNTTSDNTSGDQINDQSYDHIHHQRHGKEYDIKINMQSEPWIPGSLPM